MALPDRRRRLLAVCLMLAGFAASDVLAAGGGSLYRFRDEAGRMHVASSLPPAYAQTGYEVLDRDTLKVRYRVEPALSAEQLNQQAQRDKADATAKAAAQEAENARAQTLAAQQNHDRMLLQTYASSADIRRLRDSKLESHSQILRAVENTIGHLRRNLQQMDATLAEHKAAGRAPPVTLVNARAKTAADLIAQEQAVSRIQGEQEAIRATFGADIERYQRLTGKTGSSVTAQR